MQIKINAIYQPVKEFQKELPFIAAHRVLGIDRKIGIIVLYSLGDKLRGPFSYDLETFEHLVAENKLQSAELAPLGYMLSTDLTPRDQALFDERNTLIAPFLNKQDTRWLYDAAYRGQLVTRQMKLHHRPRKAVLRWLYHYLYYGTLSALYCGFSRRGGYGKRKNVGEKKRGRPRGAVITGHDMSQTGINITEAIRKVFRVFVDVCYNIKNGPGLGTAYKRVLDTHFSTAVIKENGETEYIRYPNYPSRRQFDYWHSIEGDAVEEQKTRQGDRRYNLRSRGLGGRVEQDCNGPTDKFEMDSTVLDLYCVSAFNRAWIIGRLILYFLVDTFSRMIVGFHLALSGPNWNEARVALFNGFSDKVSFCAKAGITITAAEWPCCHLPQTVLVDRAELRAHKPQGLIHGLGIEIDLAPPFRGDFKPVVERRFRIINDMAIHHIPGAVRARERERGERDYRLDGCLTIDEVKKVIIKCVLQHNNHREFPHLLSHQMIIEGVEPTPLAMWNWGLENIMGSPRQETPRNIYCHLLPAGVATVQADGIHWNGVRYTCQTEVSENWRALARNKGSWKIPIRWMPDSNNHFWRLDQREGSFEQCDILDPNECYRGFRVDECADAIAFLKLEAGDREPIHDGAASDDDKFFRDMIAAAQMIQKNAVKGMTKTERLSDIYLKRQYEIMLTSYPSLKNNPAMLEILKNPAPDLLGEDDQAHRNEMTQMLSRVIADISR